jgi:hypothetical protein
MAVLQDIDLDRHDKVVANIDLPGVRAGTKGKVLQKTGLTWIRYRVLFANGVEHGLLDGRHLARPKEFVPLDQRVEEVVAVPSANGDDGAAAADDGAGAGAGGDNPYGVPSHLLERSKKARERLTAG